MDDLVPHRRSRWELAGLVRVLCLFGYKRESSALLTRYNAANGFYHCGAVQTLPVGRIAEIPRIANLKAIEISA